MEPKDLLPILFERSNATATLWNIEIVVVLGLIAFLASAGKMIGHWSMKLALTVGFLVMAYFNVGALIEVTEQRQALVDFFRTLKPPVLATSSGWIDPLSVPPVIQVVFLHAAVDVLVVLFIWVYSPHKP
ncbi:MAG: hypothetical protein M3178_03730 [Pseudomonadota bacterium]|nr:hypothetical protein [Pseudomonadota bacterium]